MSGSTEKERLGEPEPELAFLEHRPEDAQLDSAELDSLFDGVRGEVERSGARPLRRLAEQPTGRRRFFALICFALIVLGAGTLAPRPDLAAFPPALLALVLGSLGVVLALAVVVAFRPIHVPMLSPWWKIGLCAGAVGLAFAVALAPGLHAHIAARPPDTLAPWGHALPCLGVGLLAGLPGYVVLRFLDRGAPFGRLLSGAAAGLGANMALELHCPLGGAEHLVLGHAMVVVLFLAGVVVIERLVVRPRHD